MLLSFITLAACIRPHQAEYIQIKNEPLWLSIMIAQVACINSMVHQRTAITDRKLAQRTVSLYNASYFNVKFRKPIYHIYKLYYLE